MIVHSGKSRGFFLSGCYFFGYCRFLTSKPDQYEQTNEFINRVS